MLYEDEPNELIKFLITFPEKPWNIDVLNCNSNMKNKSVIDHRNRYFYEGFKFVDDSHTSKINDYYRYLKDITFMFRNISLESKMRNNLDINWREVSRTIKLEEITPEILDKLDIERLSINENVNVDFVLQHLNKSWHWHELSRNKGIKLEEMKKQLQLFKKINFEWASYNPNLTMKFVLENMEKKWDWYGIAKNPGITMKDIEDNITLKWNYRPISQNQNLTLDFVYRHIDECWIWGSIFCNPGITMEDIESHPECFTKLDTWSLSLNPNLTVKFVLEHLEILDDLCWSNIAVNEFKLDPRLQEEVEVCYV